MDLLDLSVNQLKRAATIKEQIDRLSKELSTILGGVSKTGTAPRKKFTMSAAVKKKIAASQKARWAKLRRAKSAAPAKPTAKAVKKMAPATRAKLSAKLKAYWAAKKKAGKR